MSDFAVTLRDLERRFGAFVAVNRINLDVRRGEIFGFLGPNGAGKSTTIRMLCGLLEPSGGHGTVAGHDIRTQREAIKRCIGYMSQKFSLYDDLTVEENIDFYSGIYRIPKAKKAARKAWVLDMAHLQAHRHTRTGQLPGGWKQRLSLGCALLHEPQVLFLDEPTSGVDPLSRRAFWDLIYEMAGQGVTVFVTTHYMEEAEYCDRLALIYRGELVALGTPGEMKERLMTDQVLCVTCDRSHEAMGLAAAVEGVRDAALFGRDIHLMTEDAVALAPRLRRTLTEAGFEVGTVERITPSLEDVFVSLIEARDRADGAQKEFSA
ncbi:ABC transporter ATP-binding protein [Geothrix limicola]|uniref:ABC transporter ATP-binding protein n=1 Tax=Geothrix limicola TaxID=2927978 RepID=A0ABQ5QEB2_9BACT|nr:ABC transporter ATP-binding protein [Geothrix limicola]GLH72485.1 ABC transporter ATP-binding protein [Geothrix limicola]